MLSSAALISKTVMHKIHVHFEHRLQRLNFKLHQFGTTNLPHVPKQFFNIDLHSFYFGRRQCHCQRCALAPTPYFLKLSIWEGFHIASLPRANSRLRKVHKSHENTTERSIIQTKEYEKESTFEVPSPPVHISFLPRPKNMDFLLRLRSERLSRFLFSLEHHAQNIAEHDIMNIWLLFRALMLHGLIWYNARRLLHSTRVGCG